MKESRSKTALGGKKHKSDKKGKSHETKKEKAKRKAHRLHIKRTANDKFLIDHSFKSGPGEEPMEDEQHAIGPDELDGHVGEHMGLQLGGPEGASAAPVMPAGPVPQAMPAAPVAAEPAPAPLPIR